MMIPNLSNKSQSHRKARVIAYYLPQYHPIPENDEWWGKGFTEWTNVGKAKPLFKGHYQPRVPADLGYYDLRMPEIREAQAEMASNAGIEGFMYWHYWFGNGRRVLERPFDEVLKTGKPDFPFCLGWANHSWTNISWNSSAQWQKESCIVEQKYPGEKDIIDHFNYVLPAFQDHRYISVDGKPIFLIYDPLSIPNPTLFIKTWQDLATQNGLPGIHFVGIAGNNLDSYQKLITSGFNSINSNGQWSAESKVDGKYYKLIRHKIIRKYGGLALDKYDYKEIIKYLLTEIDEKIDVYPTILPQWDRSARSGRRASIYHGSTPELFEKHFLQAMTKVSNKPIENRIIFLKSWNEWAEGNYVEPDIVFGHGYLEIIRKCLL
jgi:hypothetical protein